MPNLIQPYPLKDFERKPSNSDINMQKVTLFLDLECLFKVGYIVAGRAVRCRLKEAEPHAAKPIKTPSSQYCLLLILYANAAIFRHKNR